MTSEARIQAIRQTIIQKGGTALEKAQKNMVSKFNDNSMTSKAVRHFATVTLRDSLPVFPALISLSCEAVGGELQSATPFAEAIILISSAADMHDDIIDHSTSKGRKQTVMGKFGESVTVLAGDILLSEGFKCLADASEKLSDSTANEVRNLVSNAVVEICRAEAMEIQMHKKLDIKPSDFLEVVLLKAVVPEIAMKIGAIVGKGSREEVDVLGRFGRIFGVNGIIIEEFADLLSIRELKNRLKNECLPLPVIYAMQNRMVKEKLLPILNAESIDKKNHGILVDLVFDSEGAKWLVGYMDKSAKTQVESMKILDRKTKEEMQNLLLVPLESFKT
jgi:geranylgeranyl diphosphate synthase type I